RAVTTRPAVWRSRSTSSRPGSSTTSTASSGRRGATPATSSRRTSTRPSGPDVAEHVLAAGHADIVGMARAHIAEGRILQKAREGRVAEIRPCVGGNGCISRRYVEGLGFGCAVNPRTSHEVEGPWPRISSPRSLLVVGGGPAGGELAPLTREAGDEVTPWEAEAALGGE